MMNIIGEARKKEGAIILSIISNTSLVLIKLLIGVMTGLVSVVAEALHSANDLIASLIAYFGVKGSMKPPDKDHQFGHGKVEVVTGWIENALILIIGAGIIFEGVKKLLERQETRMLEAGIAVMLMSAAVNFFVSGYLIRKGKELRSLGVEVDGEHLRADVITSAGIAAALIVMKLTGFWWIDPVAAILVGVWVIGIFVRLSIKLTQQVIDKGLDEKEIGAIEEILKGFPEIMCHHKIRTRQSGSTIFIDMHIQVDPHLTVIKSHDITKEIEMKLKARYKDVNVLVHVEPCLTAGFKAGA
ncbi:MAG TPA: cation diffusion facilitator family transporter [Candidatus Goldiibacteriota bacterium]|nr:cation diffusion facilitator family transporter [Candidatus Goldiibacteriota bacterium]